MTVVPVVKEAEGYKLFLSGKSETSYKGVSKRPDDRRFRQSYRATALGKSAPSVAMIRR